MPDEATYVCKLIPRRSGYSQATHCETFVERAIGGDVILGSRFDLLALLVEEGMGLSRHEIYLWHFFGISEI